MKPRRHSLGLLAATCLLLGGGGCRPADWKPAPVQNQPLRVVCTTGMVGDMITSLAGRHAVVENLMGSGVDPHLYKPTPGDVRKLTSADAVFYSGLHLEGRLAELLESLARWKPSYAVTEGVQRDEPERLLAMPGAERVFDPHVWFDVALWARCAADASQRLIELDPAHAADYQRNAEDYVRRLKALHEEVGRQLATIPAERRVLVTAHDAFQYFGRAYGIEVRGLQGISTSAEADLGGVNQLIDLLVARQIKAVFVESSVPAKNIRALVEGTGARGHAIRIGGELFSDALGSPGTPEGTYVGMVEHNVRTIVEALR